MDLYEKIKSGEEKIALVGLGYVGMPIAVAFARKVKVIGFDLNEEKINRYRNGIDPTQEVGDEVISRTTVDFTCDPARLKEARFHIVAVPTPIIAKGEVLPSDGKQRIQRRANCIETRSDQGTAIFGRDLNKG